MRPSLEKVIMSSQKDLGGDDNTVSTRSLSVASSAFSSRSSFASAHSRGSNKKVQFAKDPGTVVATVGNASNMTVDEKCDQWWSAAEFQAIRLAAKFTTKHVRKSDREGVDSIDSGFNTALHISCTANDEELEMVLRRPNSSLVSPVESWCKRTTPVRGLEKYISSSQKAQRLQYVAEARGAVVAMHVEGTHSVLDISLIYKEYSRHALVFARFLGEADKLAADVVRHEDAKKARKLQRSRSRSNLTRQSSQRSVQKTNSSSSLSPLSSSHHQRQPVKRGVSRNASGDSIATFASTDSLNPRKSNRQRLMRQQSQPMIVTRQDSSRRMRPDLLKKQNSTSRLVERMMSQEPLKQLAH